MSIKGFSVLKFLRNLLLLFFVSSILWVLLLRFVPVYFTPLMGIRAIEAMVDGRSHSIQKQWVPMSQISQNMVNAVIASEDNLFMQHNGFSFDDIKKAQKENQSGRRFRGGSTISQQTAKNVFLWPARSYFRKGMEAYFTVLIELLWSKERIMEVYLNVIEMGDGIYGVQAASIHYFNKDAAKITRSQSALIAVCLPSPRRFNPAKPSGYITRRKNAIVRLMGKLERVDFHKKDNIKD